MWNAMAIAITARELRRWNDLAVVRRAIAARMPDLVDAPIGLKDVAELCRRQASAFPGGDFHARRNEILMIASEWDLLHDRIEDQSDACLRCVARVLR